MDSRPQELSHSDIDLDDPNLVGSIDKLLVQLQNPDMHTMLAAKSRYLASLFRPLLQKWWE